MSDELTQAEKSMVNDLAIVRLLTLVDENTEIEEVIENHPNEIVRVYLAGVQTGVLALKTILNGKI